jgi:exodeoxyribonuclease-3
VHFPQKAAQLPLFHALAEDSASLLAGPAIVIGDVNCGIPFEDSDSKTFVNTVEFSRLLELGWCDAFRSRHPKLQEYSWVSPRSGNRFRYDHCLASPAANQRIRAVSYDQSPRLAGLSDHAALLVEIDT